MNKLNQIMASSSNPGLPEMVNLADSLLNAHAIRRRCMQVMRHVEDGLSPYFIWQPNALPATTAYVIDTIRADYADLDIPMYSRWRHFEVGDVDRWGRLQRSLDVPEDELARIRIDLIIPSVLLDAGAGSPWQYVDYVNKQKLGRSEGMAVASLNLFTKGTFSADEQHPLRADADALANITPFNIAKAFQVTTANALIGIEGRASLLQKLGLAMQNLPEYFGAPARLGNLYDYFRRLAKSQQAATIQAAPSGKTSSTPAAKALSKFLNASAQPLSLSAATILQTLLHALSDVWPNRLQVQGINMGDCWYHPAAQSSDITNGLVPFHLLSQWLTYSLVEPLQQAGIHVTGLDALTGLPEYRHGGLLLDMGLLSLRDASLPRQTLSVEHPAVVEWRAVTVIGLDRLASAVRQELKLSHSEFTLAHMLQGGSWSAGRKIAAALRPGGHPPLSIWSDGTVF